MLQLLPPAAMPMRASPHLAGGRHGLPVDGRGLLGVDGAALGGRAGGQGQQGAQGEEQVGAHGWAVGGLWVVLRPAR